jgi:N utilization substance protein A
MVELTSEDLNFFSMFEKLTGVMPTDFLSNETGIYFLVPINELGKAIGKKGANIEKLKGAVRKKVVIVPDSNDLEEFVKGFFSNVEIINVEVREAMGERAVFLTVAEKDRGIAIGKAGERIKTAKTFLKKKFNSTISLHTRKTDIY